MTTFTHFLADGQQSIQQLIDEQFRRRLINRISKENGFDQSLAERIVGQTLIFLKFVADNPGHAYAPSPLVDIGWHTFLLYTRHYTEFCSEIAGGYIHHDPIDGDDVTEQGQMPWHVDEHRTAMALQSANLPVDTELWNGHARCGGVGCTNGDCTSGGPPRRF